MLSQGTGDGKGWIENWLEELGRIVAVELAGFAPRYQALPAGARPAGWAWVGVAEGVTYERKTALGARRGGAPRYRVHGREPGDQERAHRCARSCRSLRWSQV